MRRRELAALVVVNPDPSARHRIIDLMSSSLDRNAVIVELDSLEELASYLPSAPTEPKEVDLEADVAIIRRDIRRLRGRIEKLAQAQAALDEGQDEARSALDEFGFRVEVSEEEDVPDALQRL